MLLEASYTRVHQHTQNSTLGFISASRGELSPAENNERHKQLKLDLDALRVKYGWSHIPTEGGYIENRGEPTERVVKERSMMVIGKPEHHEAMKKEMGILAKKYNQDSVLVKGPNQNAELIGTKEHPDAWPAYGKSEDVGKWHPRNITQYFTGMQRGKKRFEFAESEGKKIEVFGYFISPISFFNRTEHLF